MSEDHARSTELPISHRAALGLLTIAFVTSVCNSKVETTSSDIARQEATRIVPNEVAQAQIANEPVSPPLPTQEPSPTPTDIPTPTPEPLPTSAVYLEKNQQVFDQYLDSQGFESKEAFFEQVRQLPSYDATFYLTNGIKPTKTLISFRSVIIGSYEVSLAGLNLNGSPTTEDDRALVMLVVSPELPDEVIPVILALKVGQEDTLAAYGMGGVSTEMELKEYARDYPSSLRFVDNNLGRIVNPFILVRYPLPEYIQFDGSTIPKLAQDLQAREGSYVSTYTIFENYEEMSEAAQQLRLEEGLARDQLMLAMLMEILHRLDPTIDIGLFSSGFAIFPDQL